MSEGKDKKLATNRLLDILRSQAVGKPIDLKEHQKAIIKDKDVQEEKIAYSELSKADNLSGVTSKGSLDKESIREKTDNKPSTQRKSLLKSEETLKEKGISSRDLLNTLDSIQSTVPNVQKNKIIENTQLDPFRGQTVKEKKEISIKTVEKKKSIFKSPTSLLEQIQKPTEKIKDDELKVIKLKGFDSSLISTISAHIRKNSLKDYIQSLFHIFNESQRRITIHHSENSIRLLQIKTGFNSIEIEKAKEYVLPYSTSDGQINDSVELLKYIINKELDSKEIKYAYGSYYSPNIETKTHILQVPSLNKKELSDLVNWNAKKNIPFSPDQAIINYEISKVGIGDGNKHNVVIGISEEGSIAEAIDYFANSKLKPRLITTMPVLTWKLFLRNYPDRKSGSYVLIHIGDNKTTVSLIKNRQLLVTREILFGAMDFYNAAMQKVVTEDRSFNIDFSMAKQLLLNYGIPEDTSGVTMDSHISLYKLSIFLRPALERLTSELNRSLKYFTKQIHDVEINEMLFDGKCATFPNIVKTLGDNLNVKVGLLNPMRKGTYDFKNNTIIKKSELPLYTINFALATEEVEKINVIPKKLQINYKYLFLYKVAAVLSAFFIPIFIVSALLSGFNIRSLEEDIQTRSGEWDRLSIQSKEFIGLTADIDILKGYWSFLENDRNHSNNQIKILKMFSSIISKDIKLTKIELKKLSDDSGNSEETSGTRVFKPGVEVRGFIKADASVSDIHLTNFVMKLEQLNMFSKIDLTVDKTSRSSKGKLFFSLNMRI